jgi:HK97 family phage portal protein
MRESVRDYISGLGINDPWLRYALGGEPASTGVPVNGYTALTFSAFWAAVSIISGDSASLPLVLYKRTSDGGKERFVDHKTYELLHDSPNPEMTSMVFRETVQGHVLTWGNGYAEIERDRLGRPQALWPITPDRVTPFRDGVRLRYRVTNTRGAESILDPANVLHIPGLGYDGTIGYSIVTMARESIGMGLATERFGGTFFGNGSTFGGVLSHPGKLTKEAKQDIRESVGQLHTGVDRAHRFLILAENMKYERLGIPPNDAQFLETRRFQVSEIARWFNIPPHKLGDLERATFSNIEQQDIEYYRACLRRWLVRWEQELNRKLISPLERKQQFIKHNVEGLLRGDSAARSEFYSKMFGIGALSINDILELEDMNPIGAEGDVHYVPANMMSAENAMKTPLPTVTEVPPKALPPAGRDDGEGADLRELLSEIAGNTSALQASMAAEREAMSQAERDRYAADVAKLEEQRTALQQQFDALRNQHLAAEIALKSKADDACAETAAERDARRAAEESAAAAEAARSEAVAQAQASEQKAKDEEQAKLRAQADLEAARQTLAQTEERAEALTVESRAAGAESAQAKAAREQAERQAAESREQAEQASAATVAEREARTAAEADAKDRKDAELDRLTRVVSAHRALLVDVMTRLIRPEVDRARRRQATPDNLRKWADAFYQTHREVCAEALYPAMLTHLAWKRSDDDPHAAARVIADAHCDESERQLRSVIDGSDPEEFHTSLERLLARWEQERPQLVADKVLNDEIQHIRSYR